MADRNVDLKTGNFPNLQHLLRPGQYAKVRANIGLAAGALLVNPVAAAAVAGK